MPASKGRNFMPFGSALAGAKAFARKVVVSLAVIGGLAFATTSTAQAETRSLKLYFVHTGERATITFKRNGRFDAEGLAKLNRFLRDWRRNEPTKMDPRLFDLIWNVYKNSGSSGYINVLCGYRSPGTNAMLRSRSKGVAEKSQHILGKAMDFYIPGVPLKTLREIGLKLQMGGVGYYPTSGSPFVHMDVGGVRAWPRPSRQDLVRLFPDGKTMHVPADGHPLPGYASAMADYKRRMGAEAQDVASISGGSSKPLNFLQRLFGGGGDEDEEPDAIASSEAPAKAAPAPAKAQVQVASAQPAQQTYVENLPGVQSFNAPLPAVRPSLRAQPEAPAPVIATALVSPARDAASEAIASVLPSDNGDQPQYADLQKFAIPVPQLLGERRLPGEAETDVADVPLPGARPDQQVASIEPSRIAPDAKPAGLDDVAAADAAPPVSQPTVAQAKHDQLAELLQKMAANGELDKMTPPMPTPAIKPEMVAALAAASDNKSATRSLATSIQQRPAATADVSPKKGSRPSKSEAVAAKRSGGLKAPQLTDKMIAQWALAGNRVASAARPVKVPEFKSAALTEKPVSVYTAGFTTRTANIDPARFAGSAVNFPAVERFKAD
jgi:uncharacterized protein YcbK (DUF882 family)